jgi:hypothetical protein
MLGRSLVTDRQHHSLYKRTHHKEAPTRQEPEPVKAHKHLSSITRSQPHCRHAMTHAKQVRAKTKGTAPRKGRKTPESKPQPAGTPVRDPAQPTNCNFE